jgi:glycosyltransferase involved in cell wall biosynthesis
MVFLNILTLFFQRGEILSIVVHVTHEAIQKMGGIGAVLEGLLTTRSYNEAIEQTFLVGPLFSGADLGALDSVLYHAADGIKTTPHAAALSEIEKTYHVKLIYGQRRFENKDQNVTILTDVILVNVSDSNEDLTGQFKWQLYEHFGIESTRYESEWEYEEYVRLAEPAYEALQVLIGEETETPVYIISHEFMGMPLALKTQIERKNGNGTANMRTVFYAHEVASIRPIVEGHPGHDVRFYNALDQAKSEGMLIRDVFGDPFWYFKHALIDKAHLCDTIFAVGDLVVDELRFLAQSFEEFPINLVYNGIPAFEMGLEDKLASKSRLQKYARTLLDYRPDYVFTHVTRLVKSKGLWRDLQVLTHLDSLLASNDKTAVLFILSTEIATGRPHENIHEMEREYGWPVHHKIGYPDLVGAEIELNNGVSAFNLQSKAIKVVFVNQFGWSQASCGSRMPIEMEFMDIRKGSDAEFGQSIYEPFGIAQVEPLSFGAICVVSNVCGCCGFIQRATDNREVPNIVVADYTQLQIPPKSLDDVLHIGLAERNAIEMENSRDIAAKLLGRLPRKPRDVEDMLREGYDIASRMSWEVVVKDYFLPGLKQAL